MGSVVDEFSGPTRTAEDPAQFIAFVGGDYTKLSTRLADECKNGSTVDSLRLKNKYYDATVRIKGFWTVKQFIEWHNNHTGYLGCVILYIDKHKAWEQVREQPSAFYTLDAEALVLVIDNTAHSEFEEMADWLQQKNGELVVLCPDQEHMSEREHYNEKWGVPRLLEIIHSVVWPHKTVHMPFLSGNANLDRLIAAIESMPDDESDDDDFIIPEDEKRTVIDFFDSASRETRLLNNSVNKSHECGESGSSSRDVSCVRTVFGLRGGEVEETASVIVALSKDNTAGTTGTLQVTGLKGDGEKGKRGSGSSFTTFSSFSGAGNKAPIAEEEFTDDVHSVQQQLKKMFQTNFAAMNVRDDGAIERFGKEIGCEDLMKMVAEEDAKKKKKGGRKSDND